MSVGERDVFRKPGTARAIQWERAGLEWLEEAATNGGARVVGIVGSDASQLCLERISHVAPSARAARDFGAALAVTHGAGCGRASESGERSFGLGPVDAEGRAWRGDGLQGPAGEQLVLPLAQEGEYLSWGAMFANARVDPLVRASGDLFDAEQRKVFRRLMSRLCAGDFDDDEPPARVHGDLWAGNVLFDSEGAVLIDPAAYSGHRLDDLAALHLFGAPHLAHVVEGYEAAHPLAHEWQDVLALHSLHLALLHAALFGGGYAGEALTIARRYA